MKPPKNAGIVTIWSIDMAQRRCPKAFTVMELVIGLVLSAMLLLAVGTAMKACLDSYHENDKIATLTQAARSVLDGMMKNVRTADSVTTTSTTLTITPANPTGGLQQIQYQYMPDKKLYYRRTVNGSTSSYVLLGDAGDAAVQTFTVASVRVQDAQSVWRTKVVTVRMQIAVENQPLAMTVSASPRRNQDY